MGMWPDTDRITFAGCLIFKAAVTTAVTDAIVSLNCVDQTFSVEFFHKFNRIFHADLFGMSAVRRRIQTGRKADTGFPAVITTLENASAVTVCNIDILVFPVKKPDDFIKGSNAVCTRGEWSISFNKGI